MVYNGRMPDDPPEIQHKRWRHRKKGYEVEVLAVHNHNAPPFHRTVVVDRTQYTKKERTWNAVLFVKEFEPLGRPRRKPKTLWDQL